MYIFLTICFLVVTSLNITSNKLLQSTLDIDEFFKCLEVISGCSIIPLVAVYLGWILSQRTQHKELTLDILSKKFNALREIKSITDNIPPDLNKQKLVKKLESEEDFRRQLSGRLIRLFGLRNELMPFIEIEFVELIDNDLKYLYEIGVGNYKFKEGKISNLADFVLKTRKLIILIEKRLTKEHKKLAK